MKDCGQKKECLECGCRKKTLVAGAVFLALVASAVFLLVRQAQSQAMESSGKQKFFQEESMGLSMTYPANWTLNANYDHYAPGIFSVEINNKKCGGKPGECAAGCVDARILAAKKPLQGKGDNLTIQLYEDFMMVRDFSISPLVEEIDLASKKIFQVKSGDPTLALNGACPGPLYVFETKSYFVYMFAGYGNGVDADGQIREIINSIAIGDGD